MPRNEMARKEKDTGWRRRNSKEKGQRIRLAGGGRRGRELHRSATRDLVTTVNFTLGKKSRGRVVRPISRGLLSNKLVSERMAMAAANSPAGRWGQEGGKARMRDVGGRGGGWQAGGEKRAAIGRRGHKWRTAASARGISCQMILIGSCRAIQRRPKKAKKSSDSVKQAGKKENRKKRGRDRERERERERERARTHTCAHARAWLAK